MGELAHQAFSERNRVWDRTHAAGQLLHFHFTVMDLTDRWIVVLEAMTRSATGEDGSTNNEAQNRTSRIWSD